MLLLVLYIFYPLDILLDKFSLPTIVLSITKIELFITGNQIRIHKVLYKGFDFNIWNRFYRVPKLYDDNCISRHSILSNSKYASLRIQYIIYQGRRRRKKRRKKKLFPVSRKIFILMITHKF